MPKFIDDLIKGARDRYTDTDTDGLDYSNIGKDLATAAGVYATINPNDSNTIADFLGTGNQQPVGYQGGIPNYTASRSLVPNAFSSTYTTGEGAGLETLARRPGMAGRRYFTPTTFTADTTEPVMGRTAEQIAAANAAALENQTLFEDIFANVGARNVAPVSEVTLPDVSPTGEYSQADIDTVLAGLANNDTTIDELAATYDTPTLDVLENLILDQGQTPAQAASLGGITEENLIVQLLRAGKTNFAEVADYYQDKFPGITSEQIEENFQNTGFAEGGSTSKMTGRPNPFDAAMGLFPNPQPEGLPEEVTTQVAELVRSYGTPDKGNTFGVPRFQDNAEMMTYEYPYGVNAGFEESLDIVDKIVKLENTMAAGSDQQKEQAVRQIEELKSFGAAVNGIPQNSFEKFVEVQKLRNSQTPVKKAAGGLTSLPHNGYYLGGSTDGMADDIPAMIGNSQPAALSDGEFVVPADVVSHLGNGNSDAGAQNLYSMMERVRKDRTGNPNQGKQIDPNQYLA